MDSVKLLIENFVYPYMEKRRGNQIRRKTEELKRTQNLQPDELAAFQRQKLQSLLLHCIHNVPAYAPYKHLEEELQRDPLSALRQFPVLTKGGFKENFDSYLAQNADRKTLIENYTGGSTSEPVKFYMDRHMVEYYEAARWRGLSWWGITPGSRSVMIWGNPLELNRYETRKYSLKERWLKNRIMIPAYSIRAEQIETYVKTIRRFKPEYIYGYASALTLFSQLMIGKNLSLGLKLKAVVSTAETLHDFQRETVERAFGCPVVNEYGARDGGIIAYQCRKGSMHISAENAILEVVDPVNFETLPTGESGVLLVTDLNNRVMPRLRYQIGDRGALSDQSCECGLGLPVLDKLDGREDDMFVTVDGKFVHGHAFNHLSRRMHSIRKFQIIQESPDFARLFIIRDEGFDQREIDEFISKAEQLLPGTRIDVSMVEDIPVSGSGKFRYTIRKFEL
ncbi:MAG: phenylacetate--CoA ligase family protein [Anaerovoracaceae bacterium]|jgi:phenylacetate-CoA ligase